MATLPFFPRGFFDFNGQFTRRLGTTTAATSLSDFALGAFDSAQRSEQFGTFGARRWRTGLFAEDSWKVNSRLTLTYGFRWELMAPYEDVSNRWSNLNIKTGTVILPKSNNNNCGRSMVCLDTNTPAPRIGLAYVLDKSQKTVFRAGGGISYFWGNNGGRMMHSNPPMNIIQRFTTNSTGSPSLFLSQGLPLPVEPNLQDPSQLTQVFWAFDQHIKLAQNINWSGGIQRQLTKDLMLDVAYVGSRTNHMMNPINPNEALPGPGPLGPRRPLFTVNPAIQDIQFRTNFGASKYHSLQTNVEKRYGHGLTGHLAWTWSHNLSNSVGPNSGSPPQNSFCTACEWGPVAEDRRHMVVINHVYELPFGSGRQYLSKGFLSEGFWRLECVRDLDHVLWPALLAVFGDVRIGISDHAGSHGGTSEPDRRSQSPVRSADPDSLVQHRRILHSGAVYFRQFRGFRAGWSAPFHRGSWCSS